MRFVATLSLLLAAHMVAAVPIIREGAPGSREDSLTSTGKSTIPEPGLRAHGARVPTIARRAPTISSSTAPGVPDPDAIDFNFVRSLNYNQLEQIKHFIYIAYKRDFKSQGRADKEISSRAEAILLKAQYSQWEIRSDQPVASDAAAQSMTDLLEDLRTLVKRRVANSEQLEGFTEFFANFDAEHINGDLSNAK
ncbi:MAG: hypothetical protein M1829_000949 [Trizodia sp. TS-e1964]|nr:MAG: hypothetical protein M1829_000949 [Trizodia sp. TS-e1964]